MALVKSVDILTFSWMVLNLNGDLLVKAVSNIALQKDAIQKSTARHVKDGILFYENIASLAVDNITQPRSEFPEGGCTSTADGGDTDAWWMVDLGNLHVVERVVVYNRYAAWQRLNSFHVRVGNNSYISSHTKCHYYGGTVGSGASASIRCDSGKMMARFVSIQRTTNEPDGGFLQLCEVQVYGYYFKDCTRQPYSYGENCATQCNCASPCDVVSGRCSSSCLPGYTGSDCQAVCSPGRYGPGCSETCHCKDNAVCDASTGACPGGMCDENYVGSSCDRRLPRLGSTSNVVSGRDTSLEISFKKFRIGSESWDEGDGPVSFYRVEYQDQSDVSVDWRQSEVLAQGNSQETINYTVTGLKYNTLYSVRVVPYIVHEGVTYRGLPSSASEGRTRCGDPESVHSVQASYDPQTPGEAVTVSWQFGSMVGHHCNRYTLVRIIYQQIGSQQKQTKDRQYGDSVNTLLTVSMDRFSSYRITARTFNDEGLFSDSPAFTYTPGGTTTVTQRSLNTTPSFGNIESSSRDTSSLEKIDADKTQPPSAPRDAAVAPLAALLALSLLLNTAAVAAAVIMYLRKRSRKHEGKKNCSNRKTDAYREPYEDVAEVKIIPTPNYVNTSKQAISLQGPEHAGRGTSGSVKKVDDAPYETVMADGPYETLKTDTEDRQYDKLKRLEDK